MYASRRGLSLRHEAKYAEARSLRFALHVSLGRALTHSESAIHTPCFRLCELRPMRSRPMPSARLPQPRREAILQPDPTIDTFAPLREGIQRPEFRVQLPEAMSEVILKLYEDAEDVAAVSVPVSEDVGSLFRLHNR